MTTKKVRDLLVSPESDRNTEFILLSLVEYLNTLLGRFGLKDVVLVTPGFSGSYVLPYIFSEHRQNVRGLVTVSPGKKLTVYTDSALIRFRLC